MNPHKYFASAELISNPLCEISTYKDVLNLATGQVTRKIRKLVLTGSESWTIRSGDPSNVFFYEISDTNVINNQAICSHYINQDSGSFADLQEKHSLIRVGSSMDKTYIGLRDSTFPTTFEGLNQLKSWLTAQYVAGTPVTIWYVLEETETEQITVPSGLSGTVEGYLIQDGTPTPEAPIYSTANTAKGWYNINAYKRSVLVWNADTAYERSDGSWT